MRFKAAAIGFPVSGGPLLWGSHCSGAVPNGAAHVAAHARTIPARREGRLPSLKHARPDARARFGTRL